MKPIIFILGPSGVGKTEVKDWLVREKSYLHLNKKKDGYFGSNGFPREWDEDLNKVDFAKLSTDVHERLELEQSNGAVLSFPANYVFGSEQLESASRIGITPVVLWGKKELCIKARRERNAKGLNLKRYEKMNRRTFNSYSKSQHDSFRVEAFSQDGQRWPEHMMKQIMKRTK